MKKLYKGMNIASNVICTILCVLIVAVVIINAGSVLLQVINRYIIVKISRMSFHWTEEMSRYSMIWLCYLTLPLVYREGSMAQLDLIYERLGKKGRLILYIVTRILCLAFLVLAMRYGFKVIKTRMVYKSPMMRIPGYWLYSAPIFGCALMTYEMITEIVGVFAGELVPYSAGERRQFRLWKKGDKK